MFRFHSLGPHFNGAYKAMNIILDEDTSQGTGALWLGDFTAAQDKITLKSKGIKTVLTVAQGLNISYPAGSEINHKTYNILDIESANISKIWNDTYQRIDEGLKKGGVLVHCAAGVSRSASTVIAYLMKSKGWGFQEAFNFVRGKRSVICPNFGFQRQLRQLEKELRSGPPQQPQQQQSQTQYQPTKDQQKVVYYHHLQQAWNPETPQKVDPETQNQKRKEAQPQRSSSKAGARNPYTAEKTMFSQAARKPLIVSQQSQAKQIKEMKDRNNLALSVKPYTPSPFIKPAGKK